MNEDEIDIMLNIAKLQPITDPIGKVDNIILVALRCAHERYPYFELNNADKVLGNMREHEFTEINEFYQEQKTRALGLVDYYEKIGRKDDLDLLFEELYTDYSDNNILGYMRDIFELLIAEKIISALDASDYLTLMQVYGDDT